MAKSKAKKTTKPKPKAPPARKSPASAKKTTKVKPKPAAKKPIPRNNGAALKKQPSAKLRRPVVKSSKPINGVKVKAAQVARPGIAPAPEPMPTIAPKPGKNLAGLKTRDLEFFRDLLLAKRREIVGDMHSMEAEALRSTSGSNLSNLPMHMADMGTDNYEQEFTLGLVEKDRQLLREINLALKKIVDGTYGICEGTGKPITRARLEAKPWARYSIEYTIKLEKGMLRG